MTGFDGRLVDGRHNRIENYIRCTWLEIANVDWMSCFDKTNDAQLIRDEIKLITAYFNYHLQRFYQTVSHKFHLYLITDSN